MSYLFFLLLLFFLPISRSILFNTMPFFLKRVIATHVSMEEPAMKRKVDKGTLVNVVVAGRDKDAKKSRLQVFSLF